MTLPAPQIELDFAPGRASPWFTIPALCRAFHFSATHARNLIDDGSFDLVIDIRAPGADRAVYRVLIESCRRFKDKTSAPTDFETAFRPHSEQLPAVLSAVQIAAHLDCCRNLVLAHAWRFTNVAAGLSARQRFRASRQQLFNFIKERIINK